MLLEVIMITFVTKEEHEKKGNWDDISLKLVVENVEMGGNLQIIAQRWGAHVTSFRNRMYGTTKSRKKGKIMCYRKKKMH